MQNRGHGGYAYYLSGGPGDGRVVLCLESVEGKVLDLQIVIYGYERGLHRL